MAKFLNLLLPVSIFLLLLSGFLHPISAFTQDLGRHLIMGEIILKTFSVPNVNLFSYTYPNFPFINSHWFSEVIFYLIFKLFSSNGLSLLTLITVLSSFYLIFKVSLKKAHIIPISIISLLYFRVLFERTDIRPEIFSFLFLSIFITILYKNRKNFTRWIFILPFIELIWVNTHIYFPIGIAVLGLFFIDGIIINRKKIYCRYIGISLVTLAASSFAALLNPNFINGALYPFHVFQNYGYQIEENQNIFFLESLFAKPTIPFFKISVIFLFITLLFSFKKSRPIDLLLSLFFTYLGATAVRNFPLFVFGTFVPFAFNLSFIFESLSRVFFKETPSRRSLLASTIKIFLIVTIILQINQIGTNKKIGFGEEIGARNAADFFLENNLKGPIFNNFDIGSYLDYRFYNKEKVFVDGRPEAYPVSFFQDTYIPMQYNPKTFDETSKKYNFNAIFFSHSDQTPWGIEFLKQIVNNKEWKIVYLDYYIIILTKDNEENKKIIDKFTVIQNNFKINNSDKKDLNSLIRLSVFLNRIGWTNQEAKTYENMILFNPNYCPALYKLIIDQSPLSQIYINRFNQNCKQN
ncbi:hypothetical protein C4559_01575 [Candidatus Microgenomates bacterium]|nr:MAG: hypothetical protein C4559_01575 [Candidatus Microgenomates bacterium]